MLRPEDIGRDAGRVAEPDITPGPPASRLHHRRNSKRADNRRESRGNPPMPRWGRAHAAKMWSCLSPQEKRMRVFVIVAVCVILLWQSTASSAASYADRASALLDEIWKAYDSGRVSGKEYFSGTSADVPAHYLLAADFDRAAPGRKSALVKRIASMEIDTNRCGGWGLGAEYHNFNRPIPNPDNTIYLYTTARVVMALLASGEPVDSMLKDADCAIRTKFNFIPERSHVAYSDQPADDTAPVVYNVFANMALAEFGLYDFFHHDHEISIAENACKVLRDHMQSDGYLPYFEGKDTTDPTHHAMIVEALVECSRRSNGVGKEQALSAAEFLVRKFIGANGELISDQKPVEWAAGESLMALSALCSTYHARCDSIGVILDFLEINLSDGVLKSDSPRFQCWLAAGLASVIRMTSENHARVVPQESNR